ncbi:hypothetical protein CRE_10774 [Caenorhabditis remanei]|uniref:SET domain-containing protein n=1 Tax=Caenorhabditis remanei TaxID=31234 RepID=E3NUA5_CAERE|nr:hypothetical protein CRE_10774 [Caenorhabditis remanei]
MGALVDHPDAGLVNFSKSVMKSFQFENKSNPAKYHEYLVASIPDRIKILKAGSSVVTEQPNWDQYAYFKKELRKLMKKMSEDEDLKHFFRYDVGNATDLARSCRFIAQRIVQGRHEDGTEGMKKVKADKQRRLKKISGLEEYAKVFIPPQIRIKITDNITFNDLDVLPVYSDLENETLENLDIPDVLTYNYIDVNFVNIIREKQLARAITLSEEEQNHIKCDCHSDQESLIPCYENDACPCYIMNKTLMKFQVDNGEEPVKFKTFEPITFNNIKNAFYNHVSFACSELCKCSGKCSNNPLFLISKRIFPIQIHRVDSLVGFQPFSPVFIPAGTPVALFTGELISREYLNEKDVDYSYQITYDNDAKWRAFVLSMRNQFSEEYVQILVHLCSLNYYINPKHHGNIGRTAGHSCVSNMDMMKIYQKSLTPAHANLMMFTLEDIFPGTTLTIDYGYAFADKLHSFCKCGTFACINNPKGEPFETLNSFSVSGCLCQGNPRRKKETVFEKRGRTFKKRNGKLTQF